MKPLPFVLYIRRLGIVSIPMLLALSTLAGPLQAQASDPEAVFTAFNAAVNAHDVATALTFFAEDAVVQVPNPPGQVYRGTDEIHTWLQQDAAQHIHVQTEAIQVSGERLTCEARVDTDDLRALGITLAGPCEVIVRGGKITSFTFTLNAETVAKLQALSTPPATLPQTGGAGMAASSILTLVERILFWLGSTWQRVQSYR